MCIALTSLAPSQKDRFFPFPPVEKKVRRVTLELRNQIRESAPGIFFYFFFFPLFFFKDHKSCVITLSLFLFFQREGTRGKRYEIVKRDQSNENNWRDIERKRRGEKPQKHRDASFSSSFLAPVFTRILRHFFVTFSLSFFWQAADRKIGDTVYRKTFF